jgi:DNA-binding response OmpR family regulator
MNTILVVDDNHSLCNVLESVLRKAGFEVLTALDGEQGLRLAQANTPDLIILDIVMPKLDGYEVCRQLQAHPETAAIPVILLTVKGRVDDPEQSEADLDSHVQEQLAGYEVGALEFMTKPVRASELVERVNQLLWLARV